MTMEWYWWVIAYLVVYFLSCYFIPFFDSEEDYHDVDVFPLAVQMIIWPLSLLVVLTTWVSKSAPRHREALITHKAKLEAERQEAERKANR